MHGGSISAADLEAMQDELEEMFERADRLVLTAKASQPIDITSVSQAK